ncbi:MAG: CoA-binding protein [Candidatus Eisenbacteria bacterium]|uniref:CoA-binding protein n=1 Tax=Eiseniibacteriota bacterium TaxID=2212470 RepID=A0A7Y2EB39_UNCEI|nr:CoA-binding protein [Candidatus Eisenbacteria bacterium]
MTGRTLSSDADYRELLTQVKRIVVVGLSPKPHRDSHRVSAYLQSVGYQIVPVHPRGGTTLGVPVHTSLTDACRSVLPDLVNVFRRPDALPELMDEALPLGLRNFWLQFGVTHSGAEAQALAAGANLVVDRCLLVEHRRLIGHS